MKKTIIKEVEEHYCDICGKKFEPNYAKYYKPVFTINVEESGNYGTYNKEHAFVMGGDLDMCPSCMRDLYDNLIEDLKILEEKYKDPANCSPWAYKCACTSDKEVKQDR